MARVYLSLGSNIDREQHIGSALELLTEAFGPLEQSSVYESEAVGFDSPAFYNLVVGFDTDEEPRAVQRVLRHIEAQNARVRTKRLSARTLDLDLLVYGNQTLSEPRLTVPHPELPDRDFVLQPLLDLAPDLTLPDGTSVAELRSRCPDNQLRKRHPVARHPSPGG